MTPAENEDRYVQICQVLSILVTLIALHVSIWIIYSFYPKTDLFTVLAEAKRWFATAYFSSQYFRPEGAERFSYLFSLLAIPGFLFLSYWFLYRKLKDLISDNRLEWIWRILMAAAVLFGFIEILLDFGRVRWNDTLLLEPLVICFFLTAITFYSPRLLSKQNKLAKPFNIGFYLLSVIFTVAAAGICIYGINDTLIRHAHFSHLFEHIAYVYLGSGELINTFGTYGLFAHFLEPVFRLIGISVFEYTIIMTILVIVTFGLLTAFLWKMVRNKMLVLLGICTILYYNYLSCIFPGKSPDPYFQYYPIRTLFPALLLFLGWIYFKNRKRSSYFLVSFVCSVAVLWNPETGILCLLTWLLTLSYDAFLNQPWKEASKSSAKHIVKLVVAFLTTISVFAIFMRLRYGTWPNFLRAFDVANLLYHYGYYLSRMPFLGRWRIVALIYIVSMSYAIRSLVLRQNSVRANMTFLLSVLGLGLFCYYQGQSLEINLWRGGYPVFLLLTIVADSLMEFIQPPKAPNDLFGRVLRRGSVVILLFILSLGVSSFFFTSNCHDVYRVYTHRTLPAFLNAGKKNPMLDSYANFIRDAARRYGKPDDKIVILSPYAALLYLDLGIKRPWNGSGTDRLFLKSDFEAFKQFLIDCPNCAVFTDDEASEEHARTFSDQAVFGLYERMQEYVIQSEDKKVFLYRKRINNLQTIEHTYS